MKETERVRPSLAINGEEGEPLAFLRVVGQDVEIQVRDVDGEEVVFTLQDVARFAKSQRKAN